MDMLEAIVKDADKSGFLIDLRLATVRLLEFYGFLWFIELIYLWPKMSQEIMKIKILK